MEFILRTMKITTLEKRVEIAGEDMSPDKLRHEVSMLTQLHGWDTNVTSNQTVLTCGHMRLGNWDD
jgi:hypothetical protein